MNTFFYNPNHAGTDCAPLIDNLKECTFFMPTRRVDDKEIYSTRTPEQASVIIEKRMAKAVEDEFSRLKLEV
ncbi:hypothetical protein J2I47_16785 [Fibrella sp. HMF5335]|uniref:Uncharacterized protein n=1 Tax=Fibrella rubiginis TaxID=2817060 RepID=A0A939GK27_9BACT|nr:hypothetical protein [Fibrella rubiginis]MBO0938211.1 hypothetical protein [Fibrella rubiginis]